MTKKHRSFAVMVTQDSVAAGGVLTKRLVELRADSSFIVLNGKSKSKIGQNSAVTIQATGGNLGGAGGFAFGISQGLASGCEWIWTCDDDAVAGDSDLLEKMIDIATENGLDLLAPLIVSPSNGKRLSFPFRQKWHRIWDREELPENELIWNQAHLFNGTLFRAAMIRKIGLPEPRLFIRGDEQEYLFRALKNGYKVATTTTLSMIHPSGENELYKTMLGLLRIPIPQNAFKLSYQIRNRGYLTRQYKRIDWLTIDFMRYTWFFLFRMKPAFRSYLLLFSLYLSGFRNQIDSINVISDSTWSQIQTLIE